MTWTTTELLYGAADWLHQNDLGLWDPVNPYPADAPLVIALKAVPQSHDRVTVLNAYPVSDDAGLADVLIGLQIRARGSQDPTDVDDILDAVYAVLHGAEHLDLGPVHVTKAWRQSSAPLGQDGSHRWERSDNYYLQANRPSLHRPD